MCIIFFLTAEKPYILFFYQKCVPDLVSKKRNSCFCIINVYHFLFDKVMPDFFLHKCVPIFGRKYILNILFYTQNMYHIFCLKKEILFLYHKMCTIFFCKRIICFCAACFSCKAIFYYGSNGAKNVYHLAFAIFIFRFFFIWACVL